MNEMNILELSKVHEKSCVVKRQETDCKILRFMPFGYNSPQHLRNKNQNIVSSRHN